MKLQKEKQRKVIEFLKSEPYKLGHSVGFELLTELHNDWILKMIFGNDDGTLQAHRGSYKTTCISIALPIIMILYPNKKILFMRKTDSDVKEVVEQVKKVLLNPVTQCLVSDLYGVELKLTRSSAIGIDTNLSNDSRGTIQLSGMGISSSLTGKHFDVIFTDDIVNINDRVSKAERDRTKLIYQELQNIKNRTGRIFNTGTPWHKDDCFTLMPNPEKYDCYSTGLIAHDELEEIRSKMLGSLFAANYELKHIAAEDVIFFNPVTGADTSKCEQAKYCHVDAAYDGSDYTAFTICRKADGKYYVFGKIWRKHVDDVEDEILRYKNQFNVRILKCENNGDHGYLAKDLRKKGAKVVSYHEDMNKFLKITSYLKSVWKDVVFVEGTDKEYIEQILDFNENADHDDAPDSLSSLIRDLWGKHDESSSTPLVW